MKKCRELNRDILDNAAKVKSALKMSQDDQQTISSLKTEVERAWGLVETSHDKEAKAKKAITDLKREIVNLDGLVQQGASMAETQEATLRSLAEQKAELQKQRDALQESVASLTEVNQEAAQELERTESDYEESNLEIASLKELTMSKKSESEREQRRVERVGAM